MQRMQEKESEVTYWYDGPVTFSSMAAQAFLYFGIPHGTKDEAVWRLSVQVMGEGWQADLWRGEVCLARAEHARTRRDVVHFLLDALVRATGKPLGRWGYLLGMRPSKALYPFLAEGPGWEAAADQFLQGEKVDAPTRALLLGVARCQMELLDKERMGERAWASFYVHIPFCPSHCVYCSFPVSVVIPGNSLDSFVDTLCEDIARAGALVRKKNLWIDSIYFGGGTPTVLTKAQMERVLTAVRASIPLEHVREWTVEAGRPDTLDLELLELLKRYGVDRISVNPQTMQDALLKKIFRTHTRADILRVFEEARMASFRTVNMDFICGLPGQTVQDMEENLRIICQLRPENVTIHTLAIKRGSPFWGHTQQWELPSEAEVEQMITRAHHCLVEAGYHPYYLYRQKYMTDDFANVGYALPGHDCIYNIQMIGEHQHIVGAGAGAVSKAILPEGFRLKKLYMPKQADTYREKLDGLCESRTHLWDFLPDW